MTPDIKDIARSVQHTVDNLFKEHLIPFRLTAYEVKDEGNGIYLASFFDTRLPSVRFSVLQRKSLDETIRIAVQVKSHEAAESIAAFRSTLVRARAA